MTAAPRFAPTLGALAPDAAPPAPYQPPELLPGDVHELLVLVATVERAPSLNHAQREALKGMRSRLSGDGTPPPNLCAAFCAWIQAVSLGTDEAAISAAALAAVEATAQAGEFSRWEPLAQAMEHLHALVGALRAGNPAPPLPGPAGSCSCGWAMPCAVIPLGTNPAALETPEDLERARLKSAMVSLRCPMCGAMHGFAMPDAAKRLRIAPPEPERPS